MPRIVGLVQRIFKVLLKEDIQDVLSDHLNKESVCG